MSKTFQGDLSALVPLVPQKETTASGKTRRQDFDIRLFTDKQGERLRFSSKAVDRLGLEARSLVVTKDPATDDIVFVAVPDPEGQNAKRTRGALFSRRFKKDGTPLGKGRDTHSKELQEAMKSVYPNVEHFALDHIGEAGENPAYFLRPWTDEDTAVLASGKATQATQAAAPAESEQEAPAEIDPPLTAQEAAQGVDTNGQVLPDEQDEESAEADTEEAQPETAKDAFDFSGI